MENNKQETLEEAMNKNGYHDKGSDDLWREGVNFGSKWQQERSYSEEEVYDLIFNAIKDCSNEELHHHYAGDYRNLKQWFEQFKKK